MKAILSNQVQGQGAVTKVTDCEIEAIPHDFLTWQEIEEISRYMVFLVETEDIKPSPENDDIYGEHSDVDPPMRALISSIQEMGLEEPIIITLDGYILSGHRRFFAIRWIGWTRVPVRFAKIRRDQTQDYHRLLAAYNPQRVKSVATVLAENFIRSENYVTAEDLSSREYNRTSVDHLDVMIVEGDKGIDPIGRRGEFLDAAVQVVMSMKAYWPLQIRQVHYKLLNNPPLTQTTKKPNERWRYENNQASFNKLSALLVSARYLGHVPMHAFDDKTRPSKDFSNLGFESTTDFLTYEANNFLYGYCRNRMEGQPRHVEVLLEKNTLLNIIEPICEKYQVTYSVSRGYGNPSLWRKMENRWRDAGCKPFVLLCFSDHDPEGFDLCDDAIRSLRFLHNVKVELVRVGVTREQIEKHNVKPNFAKEDSTRLEGYKRRTGSTDTWECEALDPEFIQNEMENALLNVLDVEQMNAVIRLENEEKWQIQNIRRNIGPKLLSWSTEQEAAL